MQFCSSLSVLALVAAFASGFPRPDEYKIPQVPHDTRAQYYVLHDDGTYKYGYDTGSGIYEKALKMGGLVSGSFGFKDATGKNVKVDYTAGGADGFVPNLSVDGTLQTIEVGDSVLPQVKTAERHESVVPVVKTVAEPSISAPQDRDASYSFTYDAGDSSRKEEANKDLNVRGEYTFIADDGVRRRVEYIAGSDTGFVATADFLPKAPEDHSKIGAGIQTEGAVVVIPVVKSAIEGVPVVTDVRPDGGYSFSYDTGDSSRREEADSNLNIRGDYSFVADDGIRRQVNYIAGSGTGFIAEGDFLPKAPKVKDQAVPVVKSTGTEYSPVPTDSQRDASYSFSYDTGDSSRREEADSNLNVRGDYSFVADDGVRRQVNYIAGSDTGFVAEADFLPRAPEVPSLPGIAIQTEERRVIPVVKSVVVSAPVETDVKPDGSYSFSYDTGDSSRREEADSNLNVRGDYSFVADDGVRRRVNYIAGSDTGFVAEADFLPKAPEIPSVRGFGIPTDERRVIPVVKSVIVSAPVETDVKPDGSYSFSYDTGDSSRREEADSNLNVRGDYSFVADDGVRRQVNYIAGSGTGFVAEADFLPKSPEGIPHVELKTTLKHEVPLVKSPVAVVPNGVPAPGAPQVSTKMSKAGQSRVVGNVLLNQYGTSGSKYGYSYTEV